MGKMTLRLADDLHASLGEAAEREHRSLHAEIVVRLERSFGESVERGVTAASAAVTPQSDTPESVAVKAKSARAVVDKAVEVLSPHAEPPEDPEPMKQQAPTQVLPTPPAPATDEPTAPPPPPSPPPKSIEQILGDPKHKPKGTVSSRQALLAEQARLQAQQREDLFSLVCPSRDKHEPGVRCPQCKGIR